MISLKHIIISVGIGILFVLAFPLAELLDRAKQLFKNALTQERRPERRGFAGTNEQENFAPAVTVDPDRDNHRD